MRVPIEPKRAWRLLNHGPTTLITAAHDGRANVMAAQWVMPLDFDPPKLAIVIAQDTFTRGLVDRSGACVVQLPLAGQAALVWKVGSTSGADLDKLDGLATWRDDAAPAPMIEGCAAWLACRLAPEPEMASRYDLFVGEVTAAWVDDALWNGREWTFPDDVHRTIHHLARGVFYETGKRVP